MVLGATTYLTANPQAVSWSVTTTAACSRELPFVSPWTDLDNQDILTSKLFRREVLRVGSSAALTDAELYAEFTVQTTSGSVLPVFSSDAAPLGKAGTAQATGAGTGAWTSPGSPAWSGKLETPSALTPIAGRLRSRVVVGAPSVSLAVDTDILAA
jgi:hypothetical protein